MSAPEEAMATTRERQPPPPNLKRGASPKVAPGPRDLGSLLDVMRDRLRLLERTASEYGDVGTFRVGPTRLLYLLNHPDYVKQVLIDDPENFRKGLGLHHARKVLGDGLLTSQGELWKRHRKIIQPSFHHARVATFVDVIVEETDAMLARWREQTRAVSLDIGAEMTRLTLGVLGRTLLAADLTTDAWIGEAFHVVQEQAMLDMSTLGMVPHWAPLPHTNRFRAAKRALERYVQELIDGQHSLPDGDGQDMLTRLIDAYRDEPDEGLRFRRLRDELVTMLLAGHETTSSTLSWTWYLVNDAPEVVERVRAEAVAVLGDRTPTLNDLAELRYTKQVIQEAMRLYPPVWAITRRNIEPTYIAGYRLAPDTDIMISPYLLHRHPGFWDEPERFDPERFDPQREKGRHGGAYVPFGAGPRFCAGSNLGMAEAQLVLAMVAREWDLRLVPGSDVRPETMLALRMRGHLNMTLHPVRN
jgi:cytochrome P450